MENLNYKGQKYQLLKYSNSEFLFCGTYNNITDSIFFDIKNQKIRRNKIQNNEKKVTLENHHWNDHGFFTEASTLVDDQLVCETKKYLICDDFKPLTWQDSSIVKRYDNGNLVLMQRLNSIEDRVEVKKFYESGQIMTYYLSLIDSVYEKEYYEHGGIKSERINSKFYKEFSLNGEVTYSLVKDPQDDILSIQQNNYKYDYNYRSKSLTVSLISLSEDLLSKVEFDKNGQLIESFFKNYEGEKKITKVVKRTGEFPDYLSLIYENDKLISTVLLNGTKFNLTDNKVGDYIIKYADDNSTNSFYQRNRKGTWLAYHNNGELKVQGFYKEQYPTGNWKVFFSDGKTKAEIEILDRNTRNYFNPQHFSAKAKINSVDSLILNFNEIIPFTEFNFSLEVNSRIKEYYNSGVQKSDCYYQGHMKNGNCITYFPNSQLKSVISFKNNNEKCEASWYYPSGKIGVKGCFNKGDKVGVWNYYYPTGTIEAIEDYSEGETEWKYFYSSGNLKTLAKMIDAQRNGVCKEYYDSKQLRSHVIYFNDVAQGKCVFYYPNGQVEIIGFSEQDKGFERRKVCKDWNFPFSYHESGVWTRY